MKLLKNTIIYTAVTVLKNGLGVFLLPLYTAYLTTTDYGVVSIVMSVAQLLGLVMLLSLNGAGMRYHYEYKTEPDKQRRLWGTVYSTVIVNALLVLIVVTLARQLLFDTWTGDIPFFPFVFLGVLAAFFQSSYRMHLTFLKAKQDGKRAGILELVYFLFNLGLTVLFLVVFKLKAMGVILALVAANGLFGLISFVMFRPHIYIGVDREHLTRSLKYALPLVPHALAGWTMTLIDRIFLNSMASTSEVGVYSVGAQIAGVVHVFMVALNQAYSPWFFEQTTEGESGKNRVAESSELFVLFFAVVGLVFSFFTPEVLRLFADKAYHEGWFVTPFLAFAFVCRSIYYMVVGPVFLKKVGFVPIITFTGAVLNIVLNSLLIGPWGKTGAAVASLMTMATTSVIALVFSKRIGLFNFRWRRMYAYVATGFLLSLLVFLDGWMGALSLFLLKLGVLAVVLLLVYWRYRIELEQFYSVLIKHRKKTAKKIL